MRERKFIKALAQGTTPTQAMREAGYAEYTAKAKAGKKVRESRIQETIQAIMELTGISDERLLEVLSQGLRATKVISANIIAKSGESMADAHSMTRDFIEVDDYAVRHKYLETALKLNGYLRDRIDMAHMKPEGALTEIKVVLVEANHAKD